MDIGACRTIADDLLGEPTADHAHATGYCFSLRLAPWGCLSVAAAWSPAAHKSAGRDVGICPWPAVGAGRLQGAANGCFVDAKRGEPILGRRAASEKLDRRLRVEMTRRRVAADGRRTINDGFSTMSPKSRSPQPTRPGHLAFLERVSSATISSDSPTSGP